MSRKSHGHGARNGDARAAAARPPAAEGAAPGGLDLPGDEAIARECKAMNLATLREVFANRAALTKREARGAALVFRGVSGQLRALEYGQRE